MSREIDERVVQMKFEKGQFEKDIQTSIHNLDELKKGLDFKDASKGFEDLDRAARGVDLNGFGNAVESIRVKFSMLDVLALDVMHRISNAMIDGANAAKRFVTSLTIDQVSPGWDKYAQKTSSVQTIMAATAQQFSDTAEQMQVVNTQLDKLNWFTDETSYNFVDMVNNIGKFTSNNIGLEQSVTAMQGIANWAAISGANAQNASHAMYNLAQALGTGKVSLLDWKSIETANMSTIEFKQTVIDIATELGTLRKTADGVWQTVAKGTVVSATKFNDALSEGWFTNDVLMAALERYGAAATALNELYEALGAEVTTSRLISGIDKYTSAINKARSELNGLAEDSEEGHKRIEEGTAGVVQEIADEWGLSLEEARDWLSKFDNELMQFSLKAFKAGQEAKTFEEVISSVTDAVSTKWMKSFELMFGNYTEAKELWTNLANTLYDIFAASGDIRNEMLAQWAEDGGRDTFIDTIYASLAAIMSILNPIKGAWHSVFGEMTSDRFLTLTERLHDFVLGLIQTDEQMQKLARIFRGVFSVVDILKTAITQIANGAFRTFRRVLAALNIDIGETAATLGDILYVFSLWFKQTTGIDSIFDAIGDALVWAINKAREFIAIVQEFGPVKATIEAFKSMFTGDFQGIGGILQALGKIIGWLWQQITSFKFPTSLNDIWEFFRNLGKEARASLEEIGMDFSGLEKLFESFKEKATNALGTTSNAFVKAFGLIGAAIASVWELLKKVDWEGVILVAFGVGTLAILWRFTDALQGFAGALKNVTGVGASAKGAFDAIKGYFTELKKNVKTNSIFKVALSITALAGAFYLLAQLEWGQIWPAAAAMVAISAAAAGLAYLFGKFKLGEGAGGLTNIMLSLASSLVLFALAIKLLPEDSDILQDRVAALAGLLVAVAGVQALLMGVSKLTKGADGATKGLINFAGSILLLVLAMKLIGEQDLMALYGALPVISVLMVVMAKCGQLLNTATKQTIVMEGIKVKSKTGGAFGTAIAVVVSMLGLIYVVKQLGEMNIGQAIQGLTLSLAVIGELALVFLAARLAGKYASQAGKMMFFLGAGLALLIPTIKWLANMKEDELKKGGDALKGIVLYILVPLIAISKFSGQYAAKAGMMILEIAGALAIIQLVVKTLGKVDLVQLAKGVTAVGAVILAFGTVIGNMNQTVKTDANDIKIMIQMTAIVGILSGLILLLTILDPTGALIACAGVSAVLISLGISFNILNGIKLPETSKVVAIIGIMTLLAAVVGIVSEVGHWKEITALMGGIIGFTLAIAALAQILKNSATAKTLSEKVWPLLKFAAVLALIVAAFAGIIGLIDNATEGKTDFEMIADITIKLIGAVSMLAVAMGTFGKLTGKLSLPTAREILKVGEIAGIFALITIGLGAAAAKAAGLEWDISNLIPLATATSGVMIAMAAALKIMNKVEVSTNMVPQIIAMGAILSVLGLAFAGSSNLIATVDPVSMIAFAGALSLAIIAMAQAIKIINKVEIGKEAIGQIITLGLIMSGMSLVFATTSLMAQNTDIPHLITFAGSISLLILALAAAMRIMNKVEIKVSVGQLAIMALWVAAVGGILLLISNFLSEFDIARMITFTLSLSTLLVALGAAVAVMSLAKFPDPESATIAVVASLAILTGVALIMAAIGALITKFGDTAWFETAVEVLHNIGLGIGELVGGLVEGFVKTAIAGSFVSLCEAVGQGVAALVEGFKSLSDLPGGALGLFVDLTALVAAMVAAEFLSGLKALPGIGPLMAAGAILITGDFMAFGIALKAFAREIDGIDAEAVEHAANAVAILAKTEGDMYSIGHIIASLLGVDNFDKFGERLESLGEAIVGFATSVEGITPGALDSAVNAAEILVALEQSLGPDPDSWIGKLLGLDSLDNFGQRCNQLGTGLRNFVEKTENVTEDKVQTAVNAAKLLVELESELQPINGMALILFGNQSLGQFGTNITDFGEGLYDFAYSVRNLSYSAVQNGVNAGKLLVDLQNEIEGSGGVKGFWFGKTDLGTFSGNLNVFGQSMVDFSTRLENVNFTRLKKLVDYIREFMNLEDVTQLQTDVDAVISNLMSYIIGAIEKQQNQTSIKIRSANIVKWIGEGMSIGTNTYGYLATNAAVKLADDFILAFEKALGIASPSIVMNEEGHWVVKGLAEGINEDTSAEDAIRQKAQNIVSAFDSEIQKLGTRATTLDLEKQLWQLTDGKVTDDMSEVQKKAIEDELLQREIAIDSQKLADLARTVGLRQAELDAIAEVSGVGSEEYEKAYQTLIQSRIDLETLRQQMEEQYNKAQSASSGNWADDAKALAEWQKQNAQAYEMLGRTKDDLRRDAYKAIYNMTDNQISQMETYNEIMATTDKQLLTLYDSHEALDEYARSLTGWTGLYAQTAQTMVDTNKIITENIEAGAVDMAASIEQATADSIKKATGKGSGGSSAATAGGASLGEDLMSGFQDKIEQKIGETEEKTKGLGQIAMDALSGYLSGPAEELGEFLALTGADGAINTLKDKFFGIRTEVSNGTAQTAIDGAKSFVETWKTKKSDIDNSLEANINQPVKSSMAEMKSDMQTAGEDAVDGLIAGLQSQKKIRQLQTVSLTLGKTVSESTRQSLRERSPSRVAMEIGEYFTEGLGIGITSRLNAVSEAGQEAGNTAAESLSYAAQAIENILSSDEDFQPVITPVLDFESLKKQAAQIPTILSSQSGIDVKSISARVGQIAASTSSSQNNSNSQNGNKLGNTGAVNYNFTQNNYSPTPLSRTEIYRQTNNQFSRFKEATKT